MRVDHTDEQVLLREQLQSYFATLLTPEVKEELRLEGHGGPVHREVRQKMGADGWLAILVPATGPDGLVLAVVEPDALVPSS